MDRGQIDEAMEQFSLCLMLKSDLDVTHNNLGNAYVEKGLYDKAIEEFQIALQHRSDDALTH